MEYLEKYYQKFNEDKRLLSRHGQVEFITSMNYIHNYLPNFSSPKIVDIGAGTGRYSVALKNEGYDVTAVELVERNLQVMRSKCSGVKIFGGNALKLDMFDDNIFDITIIFGPLYHLFGESEKLQALNEAKRITKKGGIIFVAYYMNDYAVLTHGFRDNYVLESIKNGKLDKNFHVQSSREDLYSMVTIKDIEMLDEKLNGVKRLKLVASDGASDYMRQVLNKMDDETFQTYTKYHLSICERQDLIGASSHTIDILQKL